MATLGDPECSVSPVVYTVAPVEVGWTLASDSQAEPLMFLSGARAEAAARVLARASAKTGVKAKVVIHDRSGAIAGAWRYEPQIGLAGSRIDFQPQGRSGK